MKLENFLQMHEYFPTFTVLIRTLCYYCNFLLYSDLIDVLDSFLCDLVTQKEVMSAFNEIAPVNQSQEKNKKQPSSPLNKTCTDANPFVVILTLNSGTLLVESGHEDRQLYDDMAILCRS